MEESFKEYVIVALVAVILRWCVSLFPYSGAGKAPMYGDYEAQRHWQEITINLPVSDWYKDTNENDLQYWGLDYPPLTAYHSLVCGYVAKYINPDYVTLYYSRGFESPEHKLFMFSTVLIVDLLIFIPACLLLVKNGSLIFGSKSGAFSCFFALLLYPGLYLIDYGHFQYNNVSLGLLVLAVAFICRNNNIGCAICFTLALNYKQMELYHALPFFFYLLGNSFKGRSFFEGVKKTLVIGLVVIATFAVCWLPFIVNYNSFMDVVFRIFPVNRGLFEDKVASFWCTISIAFKLKEIFDNSFNVLICLCTTAFLVLPSSLHLLVYPWPNIFKYSVVNVSFIFFLFSFHVHEKSILLVALPASFLWNEEPLIVSWFHIVSIFSMLPLLVKDGLTLPALALACFVYFLYKFSYKDKISRFSISRSVYCQLIYHMSILSFYLLSAAYIFIPPPSRYPDLYPVLISAYSCVHFILFCIYFHYCQFTSWDFAVVRSGAKKTI